MPIFIGIFIPVKKQHMALGRPVNKDTQYKVIVHTLGKHRYASTKVFTVGENGKKQYHPLLAGLLHHVEGKVLEDPVISLLISSRKSRFGYRFTT